MSNEELKAIVTTSSVEDESYSRLSLLLFLVLLAVVFWTFRDYGVSWDEPFQHNYGNLVLRYYSSLFKDKSAIYPDHDLQYYGGFFEALAVVPTRVLPLGVYEARHLVTAIFGVLGIWGCWKVVRFMAGSAAAFWTALLLSLYPSYYGHMFINSKDIPFAVLYIWSLYRLLRFLSEFPHPSFRSSAAFGVITGLCMAVRIGGLLMLCYLILWVTIYSVYLYKHVRLGRGTVQRIVATSCVGIVIAYAVMLAFWPYALAKPLVNPAKALVAFSSYYQDLPPSPRDYIPRYLLFKLPEIVVLLCFGAVSLGCLSLFPRSGRPTFLRVLSYGAITVSAAFPVVYAMIQKVTLVDEIRHFLFIIPPLFCICGITLQYILNQVSTRRSLLTAVAGLLILYGFYHVWLMVELHPYEYIYYNALTGGVRGAAVAGYETDYWATGFKQAVAEIVEDLRRRDGTQFERSEYNVYINQAPWAAAYYFPPNFRQAETGSDADVYLATTRGVAPTEYPGYEVVVRRFGVPLAVAKILREKSSS